MIQKKVNLIKKLRKKNFFNISFAESCTGGLLSASITQLSGSSSFFHSSIISYSDEAKIKILKVPKNIINKHGSVSAITSKYMAKGIYKKTKTNLVVAITGIAGPDGGVKKCPVGLVFFTVGYKKDKKMLYKIYKKKFKNLSRKYIQQQSVIFALDKIIEILDQ